VAAVALVAALGITACGHSTPAKLRRAGGGIPASLLAGLRPIGRGPRFNPQLKGHPQGVCTHSSAPRQEAHVELFGANRVVLIAAGVGTESPRTVLDGRVTAARCYGNVVTLDPTGVVYFRGRATLGELFAAWGWPLTPTRLASFSGPVRVYLAGRRLAGASPASVALRQHAEIVLEVGPYVPPHRSFTFPTG
jgi:hypothetical protein